MANKQSSTPIYTDVPQPSNLPYRYTPTSATAVNTRPGQSYSTLPFQSRRASPSMGLLQSASFSMNSPDSATNLPIDSASFKHAAIPINSPIATASNPNGGGYLSMVTTCAPSTPTTPSSTSIASGYLANQNLSAASYGPTLAKHWLWNSNLFYSQSRSIHDGFLPYPSPLGSFFGNKLRESALQNSGNHHENHKNADISSSSYCSDANSDSDSLDVDGKTSPTLMQSQLKRRIADISVSNSTAKKRNPYSIEELLKKPEKKIRRIEPISFQPSIIVHNDDSSKASTPPTDGNAVTDSNESYLHNDMDDTKSINNNNHITIEVCD